MSQAQGENEQHDNASRNWVYLLRCSDGSLYCGWTNDIDKRVRAHNAGKGGKYTRSHRPVELVYLEACESREDAMRREREIKRLPRSRKEQLIQAPANRAG